MQCNRNITSILNDTIYANGINMLDLSVCTVSGKCPIDQILHSHSRLELSIAISGTGKYQIDSRSYDIKAGDIFVLNNVESHGIVLEDSQELVNMVIHFDPKFIWQEANQFDYQYLKVFFERSIGFSHKLNQSNKTTVLIRTLMLDILDEVKEKDIENHLMIKVKLLNILVLLLRYYGYVVGGQSKCYSNELEMMTKITNFIDEHFNEEIKLQQLADLVHLNPSYLSTFFKKYNGLSPIDYIVRKRIDRACEFLKYSNKKITEIAIESGFNNLTNFNKMFKRVTGKTPSLYRKLRYTENNKIQ